MDEGVVETDETFQNAKKARNNLPCGKTRVEQLHGVKLENHEYLLPNGACSLTINKRYFSVIIGIYTVVSRESYDRLASSIYTHIP
jgi:ribonuclease I